MDQLITRFDAENPCWTAESLALAGEAAAALPDLEAAGLLEQRGGVYSLTEAGAAACAQLSAELFLDVRPGRAPADRKRSADRTRLRLLLDNAHVQRWGLKDYHADVKLDVYPKLPRSGIFSLAGGKLAWKYQDSPLWRKMQAEFPTASTNNRNTALTPPDKLSSWLAANAPEAGTLDVDLLYLCRYDFMQYRDFAGHPNDPLGLVNADRFLFVFAGTEEENLEAAGKFHLWLNGLRRLFIPGYVDRDTQEQDSVNWLVFTTETEAAAQKLAQSLGRFGGGLVSGANPCEVWALSLEALANVKEKREVIWELLPDAAHNIQRTLI